MNLAEFSEGRDVFHSSQVLISQFLMILSGQENLKASNSSKPHPKIRKKLENRISALYRSH